MDDLPEIDVDAAIAAVEKGAVLVDVREQHEWDSGHAPSAILLPLSEIGNRLDDVPEGEILVICHSGMRSARVTAALLELGHEAVNVAGGMVAWQAAGGPVVTADAR
ncbi:rhodanese-like domain-containing protein [Salinibacterium soli]|uniref:Rhodanese-like domain-containing protein n=1 Tax=Antiquaquibacter soli TaxID=3064523 RepID=A0ABT9BM18_9MICO|nr:rhodanese-like domain-containing protein [Protaetiibacter sp. WY-16]MDO7882045.1 rhodanese-like domain-containing protein [Protaetiibacter sp. WY-16]